MQEALKIGFRSSNVTLPSAEAERATPAKATPATNDIRTGLIVCAEPGKNGRNVA